MDTKEVLLEDELSEDDLEESDLEFEDLKESSEEQGEKEEDQTKENKSVDYRKIFHEFITDILNTFPEYTQIVSRWWTLETSDEETRVKETDNLINHCKRVFPERFFDILYKNEKMFSLENNSINTEFLPGILFKHLWNLDISENTKEIIWKYLQLVLFSVIGNVHSDGDFKDTAKLFEYIDENELKKKLEETFSNMNDVFGNAFNSQEGSKTDASFNMPNVEEINDHINSMLEGKLGKLAMELAEETANELSEDLGENINQETDSKKVFEKLFKNPTKMMNIIKNIGSKLDEKMKSGEINESELMTEGAELLRKLKNTAGMGDIQKMFSQFNIPGLSKGSKVNVNAMESQLNKNVKHAKMKERIKTKLEAKHAKKEMEKLLQQTQTQSQSQTISQALTDEELVKFFRTGDKPDKTPRVPKNKKNKK